MQLHKSLFFEYFGCKSFTINTLAPEEYVKSLQSKENMDFRQLVREESGGTSTLQTVRIAS
jgi:hypothetical protein